MDPRDRLWTNLIFPHCDMRDLLASRAVCRAWLAQLNAAPARLWTPLTMVVHRMSYAERVLGWRGVTGAMAREKTTRANCDAGPFTRGPTVVLPTGAFVVIAGGRIAAIFPSTVQLFDANTGALVATFDVDDARTHKHAVCDRWLPLVAGDRRVQLLDCVAARLVDVATVNYAHLAVWFSVAGACVSYRNCNSADDVTVMHISGGPDGATVVREVARVQLSDAHDQFVLCERGRSYLLRDDDAKTLRLFDLAKRQFQREYTPRAQRWRVWVVWDSPCAADGSRVTHFVFRDGECDFVFVHVMCGVERHSVAIRISGESVVCKSCPQLMWRRWPLLGVLQTREFCALRSRPRCGHD